MLYFLQQLCREPFMLQQPPYEQRAEAHNRFEEERAARELPSNLGRYPLRYAQ